MLSSALLLAVSLCRFSVTRCDETAWVMALSNGYNGTCTDLGSTKFNAIFWESKNWIIKRECSTCTDSTFSVIYYRRYTKHMSRFSPYEYMCCNWFDEDNVQGVDFDLFSRYDDALAGTSAWAY